MCAVCFVLAPLYYLMEPLVSVKEELDYKEDTLLMSAVSSIILAPVLEEIGFRLILRRNFPIKYIFNQKLWDKIFPFLVYASSVIFGFVHLTNYTNDGFWFYVFSPIIITSQLIGGFVIVFYPSKIQFVLRNALSCIVEYANDFYNVVHREFFFSIPRKNRKIQHRNFWKIFF